MCISASCPSHCLPSLPSTGAGSKAQPVAVCSAVHAPSLGCSCCILGALQLTQTQQCPPCRGRAVSTLRPLLFWSPAFIDSKQSLSAQALDNPLVHLGGRQLRAGTGPQGGFHLLGWPGLLWLQVSTACASAPLARLQAVPQTSPTPLSLQSGLSLADPQFCAPSLSPGVVSRCIRISGSPGHSEGDSVSQAGGIFSLAALLCNPSSPCSPASSAVVLWKHSSQSENPPGFSRPGMAPLACAWGTCGTDLL